MKTDANTQRREQREEFSRHRRYYEGNSEQKLKALAARLRFLTPVLADSPPKPRILEISAGAGFLAQAVLEQRPDVRLTATEFVPERFTHSTYKTTTANKIACDGLALPFRDGCFHAVYLNGVLHHVPDLDKALDEIARVLAPGGRAVLIEPNRLNPLYAAIAILKPAERGVLTANYPKALQQLAVRWPSMKYEIASFTCYATFHGGLLNAVADIVSKLLVFPHVCSLFGSHKVLLLRK